jgi:hypothetical protein
LLLSVHFTRSVLSVFLTPCQAPNIDSLEKRAALYAHRISVGSTAKFVALNVIHDSLFTVGGGGRVLDILKTFLASGWQISKANHSKSSSKRKKRA